MTSPVAIQIKLMNESLVKFTTLLHNARFLIEEDLHRNTTGRYKEQPEMVVECL